MNGRVNVAGSFTVNSYISVFASTRRNRSVRLSVAPVPKAVVTPAAKLAVLSVKLVVVTTSVSPSQRPRDIPAHWRGPAGGVERRSIGMISGVVVHLVQDEDVVRGLHQLHVVVVAAGQHRRTAVESHQATLGKAAVLGVVGTCAGAEHADRVLWRQILLERAGLVGDAGLPRRQASIWRIDDQ